MLSEAIVEQVFDVFKRQGLVGKIDSPVALLNTQRKLLELLMLLGRGVENRLFAEIGTGHEGNIIEHEGKEYEFKGNRPKAVHGLFGMVEYQRAYYVCREEGEGGYVPLDERLGIGKRHTPGCSYVCSLFTAEETYELSLERFHEIFRPDGTDLVSMRKVLDMDYEVGRRLEERRQEEIRCVHEEEGKVELRRRIEGTVAVSVDATKVREKMGESREEDGKRVVETGFKDAKIAVVSAVGWNEAQQEAVCTDSSYVSAIEHADKFFQRIWVEMNRRCEELDKRRIVFLGDGASWIWDRVPTLANRRSVEVLDFYHAAKYLSDLCKLLYGEETPQYHEHYSVWRKMIYRGGVDELIEQLRQIRDQCEGGKARGKVQGAIDHYSANRHRMRYEEYRRMKIPIASGTVESACKHVVGKRLKQAGMIWSERGADGMLQIRSSVKSRRFLDDFCACLPRAA